MTMNNPQPEDTEDSFDLPEVEAKKSGKPKIHIGDNSVCTSCEG